MAGVVTGRGLTGIDTASRSPGAWARLASRGFTRQTVKGARGRRAGQLRNRRAARRETTFRGGCVLGLGRILPGSAGAFIGGVAPRLLWSAAATRGELQNGR